MLRVPEVLCRNFLLKVFALLSDTHVVIQYLFFKGKQKTIVWAYISKVVHKK